MRGRATVVSGTAIIMARMSHPKAGSTLGASGGICGLLACALVILYRRDAAAFGASPRVRPWLWIALAGVSAASFLSGVSLIGHAAGLVAGTITGLVVPVIVPSTARSATLRPAKSAGI